MAGADGRRVAGSSARDGRSGHALARKLLDGVQPPGGAVRRAIDEAFRHKSTDPVVHAAALWLAFSEGADLRLSRSRSPGWWIPGLHELIQSGHLDAAAYALPGLMTAFPQLSYLENIDFVFEHLPPVVGNGREPFVDDRDNDVQVVAAPGADTVVLAFCGGNHQLGIPMNLLDRWFAQLGSHVVYLRDRKKIGYTSGIPALGPDAATTVDGLSRLVRDLDARRVVCVGNSAGAAGALRYARRLGADRVLAWSPITGGPEYAKKVARHLPPGGVNPWGDLVPLYRDGDGVRAHIVYGEKNSGDTQQCVRMAGLPGVSVEALVDWEAHHLVHGLLRAGRLEPLLGWLVCDEDVEPSTAVVARSPVHSHPAGGHRDVVDNRSTSRHRVPASGQH